ncbi:putative rRNA methyltransferase 1, mitochondrial [Hypsibius exemplaris]|uniref:rRNA methyltransferase 1, mitochondrial n=1 Tax=Hypsibius exemplaris TaxID=2072580 RepID=A0A1W0WZ73_HYPEX|nr:putative rRNA methyltransferase 1, mitochondrial [Hypsibius exemplaris]
MASPFSGKFSPALAGIFRILCRPRSVRQAYAEPSRLHRGGVIQSQRAKSTWISGDLLENPPIEQQRNGTTSSRTDAENVHGQARMLRKSGDPGRMKEDRKPGKGKVTAEGDDVVFGMNPVVLALRQRRRRFFRLFITEAKSLSQEPLMREIVRLAGEMNIPMVKVEPAVLHTLSSNRPHQGICLDTTSLLPEPLDFDALKRELNTALRSDRKSQLWLFLDSVMDPMNFGAILRSAYFFGVDRILIFNGCPLTATVSKASAGIMEIIPISVVADEKRQLPTFFTMIKEANWQVVVTGSKNELEEAASVGGQSKRRTMASLTANGNVLLVLGNEHDGVNREILRFSDQMVCIDAGKEDLLEDANCLNVSVAAGVILSHITLKRKHPEETTTATATV